SMTALGLMGLLPEGIGRIAGGSITFDGEELTTASEARLRAIRGNDISMIFQEPMTSLNPVYTVGEQIAEVLREHQRLSRRAAWDMAAELLDAVRIPNAARRVSDYPFQMSGGQRQRVMIAMALANGPELLIADEPTTALDVTIQAQILTLLKELQRERGMAMLFITHDLNIVRKIADRVCVMKGGEIVEQGETAQLFANPTHPYTQLLLAAEPKGTVEPIATDAEEIVSADALKVWFPIKRGLLRRVVGHVKAVQSADFAIHAGETVGVVGESGSGKTTLAKAMLRLISSEGKIAFLGKPIEQKSGVELRPIRRDMQIVFQDPYGSLSPRMTIAQIIGEGLDVHGMAAQGEDRRQVISDALTEVGLDPAAMDRYPHEFSGGQRQRIAIARAMILKPKLLVLDEPTSALDMTVQVQITKLLRDLQTKYGLAYLFISHDLRVVRAMSHRILVMRQGEIVEKGSAEQIVTAPTHEYTRTLMSAAFDVTPAAAEAVAK
ncbi:MAG: ABC transporter ATP-binding protein, partial [Pseudomonadota bacterium]